MVIISYYAQVFFRFSFSFEHVSSSVFSLVIDPILAKIFLIYELHDLANAVYTSTWHNHT